MGKIEKTPTAGRNHRSIKGILSKKKNLTKKDTSGGVAPPSSREPRVFLDDDSGLGDSSIDGESANSDSHSTPISEGPQPRLATIDTSFFSATNFGGLSTQRPKRSLIGQPKTPCPLIVPKKIRLDPTEEANELPGERVHHQPETEPKILSFKNVPAILANQTPSLLCFESPMAASNPPTPTATLRSTLQISHISPESTAPKMCPSKRTARRTAQNHPRILGPTLEGNYPSRSSDGAMELKLLSQPEEQHRARYQTEGSRGAVKDRTGQGHTVVKLTGYNKSCTLQVFVASDGGVASPHLFYQACKVSGKNSTPCQLEKINGTTILKIALLPEKDMTVSCDCVGILKERNVDVEQRTKSSLSRGRKRSTKCRLVFRTVVVLPSGIQETLQAVSHTICCTQPAGVPEICRKSLPECSVNGEKELFIIGKNLKDAEVVIFQEILDDQSSPIWSKNVIPDKDYLQPTHLICEVPPYHDQAIKKEVSVQLVVVSGGKSSEPSDFKYLPSCKTADDPGSCSGTSTPISLWWTVPIIED